MDRSKYEKIFDQESGRYLKHLDDLLLKVEKEANNRDLWGEIHGKIHSIKGMARALSLEKVTTLSHLMEAWCKAYQEGSAGAAPEAIQVIYDGVDCLRHLVVRKGSVESFEDQRWYSSLIALFEKAPDAFFSDEEKPAIPAGAVQRIQVQSINEVRVRYSLIEELLGLAQEIQLLEKTLPPLPQKQEFSGVKNWLAHCTSLMKVMYFRLAHLRLMPVSDFADLFNKTLRNLAASYGKKICFSVEGGDIEADITILERLREPLVHIFRNCIAHGIEFPEERIKAGKSEEGCIFIKAGKEKENLLLRIGDDGKGIDRLSIIHHLKKEGTLSEQEIQNLNDEALFSTILNPNYSSSTKTDDLAGRGIGMSVVAQAISYLGGSMKIVSKPTVGTEFHVRLPLSLSIVQALTFTVNGYTLSIQTTQVDAIDRVSNLSAAQYGNVQSLGELMGHTRNQAMLHVIFLKPLVQQKPNDIEDLPAIGVDSIIGNRPLMMLPVGELLASAGVFAGVGIMENGDVTMVLDLEKVFKKGSSPIQLEKNQDPRVQGVKDSSEKVLKL